MWSLEAFYAKNRAEELAANRAYSVLYYKRGMRKPKTVAQRKIENSKRKPLTEDQKQRYNERRKLHAIPRPRTDEQRAARRTPEYLAKQRIWKRAFRARVKLAAQVNDGRATEGSCEGAINPISSETLEASTA